MPEHIEAEREISLSDIFWRLWKGRGVIVLTAILLACAAALYVAISALSQYRPATYLINLRNVENQRYPNGTTFSPQDLLIPEVLTELRRRFDIPPTASPRQAISVAYDSPVALGIARIYQERLSARNLTQAEIESINQEYREQLQSVMRSSLRIDVDYRALGVDANTGLAIAAALPQIWTSVYTTQFRIFTDRQIAENAVSRSDEDLSSFASILVVNARLDAMRQGLNIFISDNRLSMLQTANRISPADLNVELRRFVTTWFNPIKASRLHGNDVVASSYMSELRLDIAERQRRVEAFDVTLSQLREYHASGRLPSLSTDQQPIGGEQASSVQITDSALSEIVQLAEQASFAAFVQDALRNQRQLMFEISALTKELELASLETAPGTISSEFRTQAAAVLADLTRDYSELVATAANQLRDRGGELFEPALGPFIAGSLISVRNLLIVAAAGLGGFLLAVLGVLMWSGLRQRRA